MNSPTVIFNENDLSQNATLPQGGVSGVSLKTKRGPIGDTNTLIGTWGQFQRVYGGYVNNASDPAILMAKRALDGGSALRVNRMVHYNDVTDPDSHTAEYSAQVASNLFTLSTALVAGTNIEYTNATSVDQDFDTSSLITLKKLAAKILAAFSTIHDVIVIDATHFMIVPTGAAIAGDSTAATGVGAPTFTRTAISTFQNSDGDDLFGFTPKYPGVDYDNLKVTTGPASNGNSAYFDLAIYFRGESELTEIYRNLKIPGAPTDSNSNYLKEVVMNSNLVDVVYSDLSGIAGLPIVPRQMALGFFGGSDGDAIVAADYIGDSSGKTGFYSFDGASDVTQIAVLDQELDNAVHVAGAAYAAARKDLQYFAFIHGDTEAAVAENKDDLAIDTSYVMFFAGKIKVLDPQSSLELIIPSIGDILGLAAYAEKTHGLWYSFSAYNRGQIQNSLGASNKWGSAGNQVNLDMLANHQVNVVTNRNNRTLLWGSFTGQLNTSQLSLANIRRFHIHLKKGLGPLLEQFLEEPCDIPLFKQIYLAAKRFLDPLIPARAMFDYRWEGDQFANSPADFKVNDPNEVALGNYKVYLFVKDIASLQQFKVEVTLTPAGISFEDALEITQPA